MMIHAVNHDVDLDELQRPGEGRDLVGDPVLARLAPLAKANQLMPKSDPGHLTP
jgi:hypothetical protein